MEREEGVGGEAGSGPCSRAGLGGPCVTAILLNGAEIGLGGWSGHRFFSSCKRSVLGREKGLLNPADKQGKHVRR